MRSERFVGHASTDLANAKRAARRKKSLASRAFGAGRYRRDVELCYKVDLA
jgi:hypothetical protein